MDLAAIGAMSIQMHLAQTQQSVDVSMTKKAMDLQETQASAMIDALEASVPVAPSFGHQLDVLA